MVKYSCSAFIFMLMTFLLIRCQDQELPSIKSSDIYCNYVLYEIQADSAIDINFDGTANVDLTKELDLFTSECRVFFARPKLNRYISIAWLEVRIDHGLFLMEEIPSIYNDSMSIRYLTIGRTGHYVLNEQQTQMILEETPENDYWTHFTFVYPKVLNIDKKQNIISFQTEQTFLVKEGLVKRTLTAKFKPNSPNDVFK